MTMTLDGTNGVTFFDTSLQKAAASPYVLKNRIINGDMRIDQRNAGASTTPTNSTYSLDRWVSILTAASKFSVQQNAGSVTPPAGFTNYLGVTSLSSYSVGASEAFGVRQIIEGFNVADLGWGTANAQTITISFWVRSSLTGTFGVGLLNDSVNRAYAATYTILVANTWEQKTITIAGDTSGTWLSTNGIGLYLTWQFGYGSSISGTANVWNAGTAYAPTGATSVVGTNGATFYITGVQLEVGSTATPFERRLYNQELANCQRYTFKRLADGSVDSYAPLGLGRYYGTNTAQLYVPFPVTMRTSPSSVTVSGNTTIIVNDTGLTGYAIPLALNETSCDGATLIGTTTSGTTAGYATTFYANNASVASIIFNAEL